MALFFGLLSALSFGISNTYWKKAARDVDYPILIMFRGVIATLFFCLIWVVLARRNLSFNGLINLNASSTDYLGTIILCMVCSLGLLFFLKSMKYAPVSITIAISSINIVSILTTIFVVGEQFTFIYLLSFLLAISGILLIQKFKLKQLKWEWNKGATFALLASLFWGTTYPLFKFAAPALGVIPLSFILECSVTIVAVIWSFIHLKENRQTVLFNAVQIKHYGVLAGLLIGGTMFFNLAIQQASVLQLNVIGNFQFVVSILLSLLIYKERLTLTQLAGISLVLLSLVCASQQVQ